MYQLRIYTIDSEEAMRTYAHVHWRRHKESLKKFGVTTEAVFQSVKDENYYVIALVSYCEDADIQSVDEAFMNSRDFKADMEGFDFKHMRKVEGFVLDRVVEIAQK